MLISFAASSASIDVTGMSVQELMISSTSLLGDFHHLVADHLALRP